MGAGLGMAASLCPPTPAQDDEKARGMPFVYRNRSLHLRTYGLDGPDHEVLRSLTKAKESMDVEPSIRSLAHAKFASILVRLKVFFKHLLAYKEAQPATIALRLRVKKASIRAQQAMTDFEAYIWDSPELTDIVGSLRRVQQIVSDLALSTETT